jgi:uridine kinase
LFAASYNFDHPSSIDFDLLADHLEQLRSGQDVEIPTYDFVHHRRTDKTTIVSGSQTHVIIVDGIFVLCAERVRLLCDVTIFCTEDMDVCLARRLRRDIVERGRTVESVLSQYLKFVKAGFTQFVAPTMTTADLIIPRARDNVTAITMLARDIERRVLGTF